MDGDIDETRMVEDENSRNWVMGTWGFIMLCLLCLYLKFSILKYWKKYILNNVSTTQLISDHFFKLENTY